MGAALGLALPAVESAAGGAAGVLEFGGEPAAARDLLATVATLTVSIVGLSFSVTLVALTLATQQLSPRVLRTFRRDRLNQATLGTFLGLAVYALLVLRSVRAGGDPFVPGLSITLALAGTVVALAVFVAFVSNIVLSLQPATVIRRIARDGEAALRAERAGERYDGPWPADAAVVRAVRAGFVQAVDAEAAAAALARAGRRGRLVPAVGDFVVGEDPVFGLDGPADAALERALLASVSFAQERNIGQDVAFPIRQLADIALKGLSPSLNDPTTAENALGSMTHLLVQAARCGVGPRAVGNGRLLIPEPDVPALLRLGTEQVERFAKDDPGARRALEGLHERVRATLGS